MAQELEYRMSREELTKKDQFVRILVGPTKAEFTVHEDLICHFSPYFRNLFRGNFKEATSKVTELLDVPISTAVTFLAWLYDEDHRFTVTDSNIERSYSKWLSLYLLADKYEVPLLRGALVLAMFEMHFEYCDLGTAGRHPNLKDALVACEALPRGSPVVALFTDIYADNFPFTEEHGMSESDLESVPVTFLYEITKRLARRRDPKAPTAVSRQCSHYIAMDRDNIPTDYFSKHEIILLKLPI